MAMVSATFGIFAAAVVTALFICGWRISYRIGFRDGREQGYSESYQLYLTGERARAVAKREELKKSAGEAI